MLQKYYEPIFIIATLGTIGLILSFFAQYSCLSGNPNGICILSITQYRVFLGIIFIWLIGYIYLLSQNFKKAIKVIIFCSILMICFIGIIAYLQNKFN